MWHDTPHPDCDWLDTEWSAEEKHLLERICVLKESLLDLLEDDARSLMVATCYLLTRVHGRRPQEVNDKEIQMAWRQVQVCIPMWQADGDDQMGTRFESLIGRLSRVRQRLGEDYLQDVRQRLLESLCMKLRFGLPINLTLHEFNRAIDTVAKQHHRRPRTVELPDESHLRLQHECEEYDYQRVVGWLRAQLANGFGAEQVIEYVMHDLPLAELAAKLGITKAKARRLVDEVLELLKQRWDEDQLG